MNVFKLLMIAVCALGVHTVFALENESLRITPQDGALIINDKRSGVEWRTAALEGVTITRNDTTQLSFTCGEYSISWTLEGAEAVFQISAPATQPFNKFAYPPAVITQRGDVGIFPFGEGMAYPLDDASINYFADSFSFNNGMACAMGFFGIQRGKNYLMIGVADTADAYLRIVRHEGLVRQQLVHVNEKGCFGYTREGRLFFASRLAQVCAAYRAWRERRGGVVTLKDKLRVTPSLANFPGTADVWIWDENVQNALYHKPLANDAPPRDPIAIAREMKSLGMDRVLWNSFEGESRETCNALKSLGFFVGRYDCLRDMLPPDLYKICTPYYRNYLSARFTPIAEEVVRRNNDGTPALAWKIPDTNGVMHHLWGSCDALSSRFVRDFILPEVKDRGYNSRLMDVQMHSSVECFSTNHPCTRTEAFAALVASHQLLAAADVVVGVEVGNECGLAGYHYSEGLTSCPHQLRKELCWQFKHLPLYGDDVPSGTREVLHNPRYRIPLWELVWHDCSVSYYYWADSTCMYPELMRRKDLFCALYGLPPIYSIDVRHWNLLKNDIASSYKLATIVARRTMFQRMTDFEILTPDAMVQRTRFADGTTVTVNFSAVPQLGVPPTSFTLDK